MLDDLMARPAFALPIMAVPSPFEIGIGALEFAVPMRESEFGFVLIDQQTGTTLMHCGCYGMWYLRGN